MFGLPRLYVEGCPRIYTRRHANFSNQVRATAESPNCFFGGRIQVVKCADEFCTVKQNKFPEVLLFQLHTPLFESMDLRRQS